MKIIGRKDHLSSQTWPKRAVKTFIMGAVFMLLLFNGCKKDNEKKTVLAQVGTAVLTLEDLREVFPPEYEQIVKRDQYLDYIKRWIDDESVYQQAQKAKLYEDEKVMHKLERMRRKIMIEEFLARESAAEIFEPDEMSINQYYEMHKDLFKRHESEYKYVPVHFNTLKEAKDLRAQANGDNFQKIASANSQNGNSNGNNTEAQLSFKKLSDLPACLAADLYKANQGQLIGPIACEDGFYLIRLIEKQEAGSAISYTEAKEEISNTLILDRKEKVMDGKVKTYKEGIAITTDLDKIPGQPNDADLAPAVTPRSPSATSTHYLSASPATAETPTTMPSVEAKSSGEESPQAKPHPAMATPAVRTKPKRIPAIKPVEKSIPESTETAPTPVTVPEPASSTPAPESNHATTP